jgi:hypothetical protein
VIKMKKLIIQIPIDVRVPTALNGNGLPFRAYMGYDTGSTSLTVWDTELSLLGVNPNELHQEQLLTAAGHTTCFVLFLEVRVLTESKDRILIDWHVDKASVRAAFPGGHRLSSKTLNGKFLNLERPRDLELLVASSKTQLKRLI